MFYFRGYFRLGSSCVWVYGKRNYNVPEVYSLIQLDMYAMCDRVDA